MIQDDTLIDKYEVYEELFDPAQTGRETHSRLKANHKPKKTRSEIIAGLTDDTSDVELGFETTYRPSRYESGWLLSSLYSFYDEGLISDVLAQIKGGKEASVYRCQATAATGGGMLAAKVYRPRMFRNLRNDSMYRQGREILVEGGGPAGRDAGYIERAIRHKTAFGLQAAHTSWLMYEFTAMEQLYEAGGAVPRPMSASLNAILMSYHGDDQMAAPTLNTVDLEPDEAESLFREVLRNIELMLQHDLVHGDLSAYNILYWAPEGPPGEVTLIDFPQVVNLRSNPKARSILERDIQRICEYFAQQGVACDAAAIMHDLWSRHMETPHADDLKADWSRLLAGLEDALRGHEEAKTMPDWAPPLD
ncbi:MAG: RIO1 family regulatory kinase/ATPase [Anaerolineae bacterium]